jgi:chaperonin GroES
MPRDDTTADATADRPPNGTPRARRRKKAAPAPSITLTGDRLVVRDPDEGERKTATGLLIPATAVPAPKRLAWGEVTLTGPEVRVAKAGDRVLYLPSSGLEVELEGADYVLLRERDVQAVSTAELDADRGSGQYL